MSKRGLGMGLSALIPMQLSPADAEGAVRVLVSEVSANRFQPRREFDQAKLEELAESIRRYGVLQPVVVRKVATGYELVVGERRWRASRIAGLEEIPALVRDYSDSEMTAIALVENLQREDLNPMEEARAYRRLMDEFSLTQEEVSQHIGKSRQ